MMTALLLALIVVVVFNVSFCCYGKKLPETTSTLLESHRRFYVRRPPHDTTLYDVLKVSPNATVAQISKSYRNLSRKYHPDKVSSSSNDNDDNENKLQQVRNAYDVLKDDKTRLLYHRYGLLDTSTAAFLLTGGKSGRQEDIRIGRHDQHLEQSLLRLMGYDQQHRSRHRRPSGHPLHMNNEDHQQRVRLLATNLVERIRPLVEGSISASTLADAVARECNELKKLPLGAQIIRCVGRAYRHSGQRIRRSYYENKPEWSDALREKFRDVKNVLTAAAVGGHYVLREKLASHSSRMRTVVVPSNDKEFLEYCDDNDDDDDHTMTIDEEESAKQSEVDKAMQMKLESMQIEALWKVYKVELDRTIREACNLVLRNKSAFFFAPGVRADGWVSVTSGKRGAAPPQTMDASEAIYRAATALELVGNVMVKCSKEGTAWRD